MAKSVMDFFARSLPTLAADIEAAIMRLPEDKRGWAPADTSRSALDQVAEIAIINGGMASTIANRGWTGEFSMEEYRESKAKLAKDWDALKAALTENTAKVSAAIQGVREDEMGQDIQTPFGPITMEKLIAMPYWNMSYHEGQINYIASILGCLP